MQDPGRPRDRDLTGTAGVPILCRSGAKGGVNDAADGQGAPRGHHGLAGRVIRSRRACTVTGSTATASTAPTCRCPSQAADLELAFKALPRLGFRGWNVTVPHKVAACRLVDELDPAAARIGALNTVLVLEDGRTRGLNTDGLGFVANLRALAPDWRPEAGPALLLGPAVARAASGRRCWTPACRCCA